MVGTDQKTLAAFTVDDTDSSLKYSGSWYTGGTAAEFKGTTHGTTTAGSSVTFLFNGGHDRIGHSELIGLKQELLGTLVSAIGTVDSHGAKYSYILDGNTSTLANKSAASPSTPGVILFYLANLDDQEHNVTITSEGGGGVLWLDYFAYTGYPQPPAPAEGVATVSANSASHRGYISPGAIAAIAIGGLIGLGLLVFLTIFTSRRWHRIRVSRPQKEQFSKAKGFEILPPDPPPKIPRVIEALRVKFASRPAAPVSQGTTIMSSSAFTSVIFNYPHPTSSRSAGSAV
ncbi:hypothetical protein BDW22DRAFT_1359621 [Trametopsis cervina]|nr:hypothetical protein BDW22DRAFT_1359621 [Trametopsis cervina]